MQTKISGIHVDLDKPCEVLKALRAAKLKIATGSNTVAVWFGDDKVQYGPGDKKALAELIAEYEGLCNRAKGKPTQRKRFAMRFKF